MAAQVDDLTSRLRALGINRTPSAAELAKLVKKKQDAKERGQALAQRYPMTQERYAKLLYAKANKAQLDAQKISFGGRQVTTEHNGKVFTKVIVPSNRAKDYSNWLEGQIQQDQNGWENAQLQAEAQQHASTRLKGLITFLNNQGVHMTTDVMTYVKRMINRDSPDDQITAYLAQPAVKGRLLPGRMDPVTKKTEGAGPRARLGPVPAPAGVAAIPPRKPYVRRR